MDLLIAFSIVAAVGSGLIVGVFAAGAVLYLLGTFLVTIALKP